MSELKKALINLGHSSEEADKQIKDAKIDLQDYLARGETETAYNICSDYWGLEPDYLEDLI